MARCTESVSAHSAAFLSVFVQDLPGSFSTLTNWTVRLLLTIIWEGWKRYPKMWTRKEKFLELWEWFYCLALFMVCSLTACAGGIQQVTPAGVCLLMVPYFWHKNILSYFSFSHLFLTWRCQTNANCFGQSTVFCVRGGHRKGKTVLACSMSSVIKTSGTCHLFCSCVLDANGCGIGDKAGALGQDLTIPLSRWCLYVLVYSLDKCKSCKTQSVGASSALSASSS